MYVTKTKNGDVKMITVGDLPIWILSLFFILVVYKLNEKEENENPELVAVLWGIWLVLVCKL